MSTRVHYPAVLYDASRDGWFAVVVPGININAQGRTQEAALIEAAETLQEVIDDLISEGAEVPGPAPLHDWMALDGPDNLGRPVVIQAMFPAHAA